MPLDLDSPYQISKVVGEFYSVYYHRHDGLPTVRARFQNVYGPGEIARRGRVARARSTTVWRNVTPTFVYRALKGLPLRLDNDGSASRDFVYVDDIVDGLLLCATAGRARRRLQPRERRRDDDPRAGGARHRAERAATSESSTARAVRGTTPIKRFGSPDKAKRELGFEAACRSRRAPPHGRMDAREPGAHRPLRRAPRGPARDGLMAAEAPTTTRVWRGGAPWTRSAVDATRVPGSSSTCTPRRRRCGRRRCSTCASSSTR